MSDRNELASATTDTGSGAESGPTKITMLELFTAVMVNDDIDPLKITLEELNAMHSAGKLKAKVVNEEEFTESTREVVIKPIGDIFDGLPLWTQKDAAVVMLLKRVNLFAGKIPQHQPVFTYLRTDILYNAVLAAMTVTESTFNPMWMFEINFPKPSKTTATMTVLVKMDTWAVTIRGAEVYNGPDLESAMEVVTAGLELVKITE